MTGRTPNQRERDKRRISQMYLQGEIQADIAAALEIDQSTVSRTLKALQEEWRQSALIDINEAKARELAKIDALELEYWAAWKRSQENAEVETTKMQGNDPAKPGKLEKQRRVEGQVGDPRYLAGVQWCIERRCAIVGIDAPQKQQVENNGKVIFEVIRKDVPNLTPDSAREAGAIPEQSGQEESDSGGKARRENDRS